jgi:aspartate beta-hydroxylase
MTNSSDSHAITLLEQQALAAMRSGKTQAAVDLWAQVVQLQPDHQAALTQLGQAAFVQRDFDAARVAFERATRSKEAAASQWINLALVCREQGDQQAEGSALLRALELDPYELRALLLRGDLFERQGKDAKAAAAYGAATAVAPPMDQLPPELQSALGRAAHYCEAHRRMFADSMDRMLESQLASSSGDDIARFKLSLDILLGRKRRFDSQPMRYFFPGLPAIEFFDTALFAWTPAVESAYESIKSEYLASMAAKSKLEPYISYNSDQPVAQWSELNNSLRWSVLHLIKAGTVVEENALLCPQTLAALQQVPQPDQPGRTPVAMFSVLQPKTRIPAHVGASNARVVAHLPLIVPPDCEYRVGNTTKQWESGRLLVFDDTIEHEAVNGSDQPRVVLIFDAWHPSLSLSERKMITAMNVALNSVAADAASEYDV